MSTSLFQMRNTNVCLYNLEVKTMVQFVLMLHHRFGNLTQVSLHNYDHEKLKNMKIELKLTPTYPSMIIHKLVSTLQELPQPRHFGAYLSLYDNQ